MKTVFNLQRGLQLAERGDKDAQLALSRYYFDQKDNDQLQRWFIPLLEARFPPALLSKVDFLMQQNVEQGLGFLLDLAKHKVPGANYQLAFLLYFHPEVSLDFSQYLSTACEQGEHAAIIAAASLFYQLGQDLQATRLLTRYKDEPPIARLLGEMTLTIDHGDVDFSLLKRPSAVPFKPQVIAPEINLLTLDNFLCDLDCAWFKLRSKDHLQAAGVVDGASGEQVVSDVRTCQYAQLIPDSKDWILLDFEWRVAGATNIIRKCGEVTNVLWYQPGQHYKAHYDAFHPKDPGRVVAMKDGGQRVRTALCYLNTPEKGGETKFPRLEQAVKGKKGMLILFDNVDNQGNLLEQSLHQGVEVTDGEKWLISKWLREETTRYSADMAKLHL